MKNKRRPAHREHYKPYELERAWQNRKLVMQKIIEPKGGNRFNIPHITAAERAALLPPN